VREELFAAWEAHKKAYEIVRAEMDDIHRTLTQCGVPEQIPPFKTALAPAKARVLFLSARCNQLFDEAEDLCERLDQFDAYGMPNVATALDRIAAAESRLARAEEALREIAERAPEPERRLARAALAGGGSAEREKEGDLG
jgi:hypothetical protein